MSILSFRTRSVADMPEEFARAAELSRRALDGGADDVDCQVFEDGLGGPVDYARNALCVERAKDWQRLAILHLNGWGVPRDVSAAEAILARAPEWKESCTGERIAEALEKAKSETQAPFTTFRWCEDLACTTVEAAPCIAWRNTLGAYRSSAARKAHVEQLGADVRPAYVALRAAFRKLVQDDSMDVYHRYMDGTLRGAMGLRREQLLQEHFDRVLERMAKERKLPASSPAELAQLRKELSEIHKRMTPTERGINFDPASYTPVRRKADASWRGYVQAWDGLARRVLPGKPLETAVELEALLVRERIEMFEDEVP